MHLATKQHIIGMINMIRQAASSIESALSSDEFYQKKAEPADPEASGFLTQQEEDLVGKMLGLIPDGEPEKQDASKKPARKKLNDEKRLSIS